MLFVLKMDEAEVVHGRKFERINLTLMYRVLDTTIQKSDDMYFSVQSETKIWPIACFEVAKEFYDVLQWMFQQTQFPALIKAHDEGQLLTIEGVENFKVEWHLSADMKTIKCLYGLKHGANATYSCIYCNQQRTKPVLGTVASATAEARRRKHTWHGGLFVGNVLCKPHAIDRESRWKPILPIPLERLHICTLHALTRMMEKILLLHFMFIWNMKNEERQQHAIENMEKTLSAAGLHGGNVHIMKDPTGSGASNSVPIKPSLSGVTVARMFQPSTWSRQDRVWKDVLRSESNTLDQGRQYLDRVEMWKVLEKCSHTWLAFLWIKSKGTLSKVKLRDGEALGEMLRGRPRHSLHSKLRLLPTFAVCFWSCGKFIWWNRGLGWGGLQIGHTSGHAIYL